MAYINYLSNNGTINYLTNLKLTKKHLSIFEIKWPSLAHKISSDCCPDKMTVQFHHYNL